MRHLLNGNWKALFPTAGTWKSTLKRIERLDITFCSAHYIQFWYIFLMHTNFV
jgi:hypothetical protein